MTRGDARPHVRVAVLCGMVLFLEGYDIAAIAFAIPSLVDAWHVCLLRNHRFILNEVLWEIPADNPNAAAFTPELIAAMDAQMRAADLVTVSTEPLADAVLRRGCAAVTVLPNGDIDYPLVGRIHVGGETPDQAARTITQALKRYLRRPIVSVAVVQQGPLNVLVLGNVKTPGKYALPPTSNRLTDAIAAAGGLAPFNGSLPNARVSHNDGPVTQVSLQRLFHDGDISADTHINDGSIVYIPAPLTFNVEVLGAVDHPGEIQLN